MGTALNPHLDARWAFLGCESGISELLLECFTCADLLMGFFKQLNVVCGVKITYSSMQVRRCSVYLTGRWR